MARFIGYLEGGRGRVSRLGHKTSGIVAQVQGWHSGVRVVGRVDPEDENKDVFDVYATSGSNGLGASRLIATVNGAEVVINTGPAS